MLSRRRGLRRRREAGYPARVVESGHVQGLVVAVGIAALAGVALWRIAGTCAHAAELPPETAARSSVPKPRLFRTFVQVSPFADGKYWFLISDLDYEIENTGIHVRVPRGFVTDFASIPRPFWSILPTWGKYGPPSIVHDYLYWDQRCTRKQADAIMSLAMEESRVGPLWRHVIHGALRVGGAFAWCSNTRARAGGEEREFPEKYIPTVNVPTITWENVKAAMRADGYIPTPRPTDAPAYCDQAERRWREVSVGK